MDKKSTYTTDREDGRFLSTMGLSHALMKHLEPALTFRADTTPAELET